ncbi:MAG: hypothetical protein IJ396_06805 [Oscillibacter sp.]|nr:hypothetical protein [Oscillibacter sp.]
MKAIVYKSQTGFTERYAKLLSEKTGVPAYPLKQAGKYLRKNDDIFYMGWLMAGRTSGLDTVVEKYTVRGVAIVGMSPGGNGGLWDVACKNGGYSDGGAPVFYLRGGYAPDKLKGLHRLLMKPMANSVVQEIRDKGPKATESELEMMNLFLHGGDCFDEAQLEPIVRWFQTGLHDGRVRIMPNATL